MKKGDVVKVFPAGHKSGPGDREKDQSFSEKYLSGKIKTGTVGADPNEDESNNNIPEPR